VFSQGGASLKRARGQGEIHPLAPCPMVLRTPEPGSTVRWLVAQGSGLAFFLLAGPERKAQAITSDTASAAA